MRIVYIPSNERVWAQYYQTQAAQTGAGFVGIPYQRGSGLGSLFRGIFRTVLPVAKSVGKSVGKAALTTGAQIASDVIAGKNVKESAEERGRAAASDLLDKVITNLTNNNTKRKKVRRTGKRRQPQQQGRGLGVRGKRKTTSYGPPAKSIKGRKNKRMKVEDQLGIYYTST